MDRHLSPRYGQVILVSGCPVLTRDYQIFWNGQIYLTMGLRPRVRFARAWSSAKKANMNTYNIISSTKVEPQEVSLCSRAKQGNKMHKGVLIARSKFLLLLFSGYCCFCCCCCCCFFCCLLDPIYYIFLPFSLPSPLRITRFYLFVYLFTKLQVC